MPNRSIPQNMTSIEDNSMNPRSAGYAFNAYNNQQNQMLMDNDNNYLSNDHSNEYSVHQSRLPHNGEQ